MSRLNTQSISQDCVERNRNSEGRGGKRKKKKTDRGRKEGGKKGGKRKGGGGCQGECSGSSLGFNNTDLLMKGYKHS